MIFVFSATGNSMHVARRIANATEDYIVDIADCLRSESFEFQTSANERVGFVFPTYFLALRAGCICVSSDNIRNIPRSIRRPSAAVAERAHRHYKSHKYRIGENGRHMDAYVQCIRCPAQPPHRTTCRSRNRRNSIRNSHPERTSHVGPADSSMAGATIP